jgi:amidase
MASGRSSSRQITAQYLERIAQLNRRGPQLRHVIETNPEALAIAERLDRERRAKGPRGPLHGIPILLKDNIDTGDRMQTTAGSLALDGAIAPQDAFIAERLRAAGAVILGKANMSEWANFRSTHSTSGWSGRGGQCRNPYALDRNPCGSSSGSAAAVSANLTALAIGTETDGSIVCPSSANSIVGIKPTLGLVSRSGIIPISHSQDTAGPMARTVTDAAILLGALTGVDPRDPATAASEGPALTDYTRFLDPDGLRGARIGIARKKLFGYHAPTDALAEAAIEVMRAAGAEILDPADIPHLGDYDDAENTVLQYEFKADLNAYLAAPGRNARVKNLDDIIAFNEANRTTSMPYFGQETMLQCQPLGGLDTPDYLKALETCRNLSQKEGIDAVMDQYQLDAILAPTGNPPWPTDLVNGDHFTGSSSTPAAVAGYASVSVPAGYVFGLPVGISFIGRAWSEGTLIKLAFAYEQATRLRTPPRLLPTARLG